MTQLTRRSLFAGVAAASAATALTPLASRDAFAAAPAGIKSSGYHFPFPCLGHVEKDGVNYRLAPGV